jgi:hypothetical protein
MWKSMLVGAVVALLLVGIAVALVATGTISRFEHEAASVSGPVLVAIVLPDENGVVKPRVIDTYTRTASGWELRSVDPSMPAVVSGTSAGTLQDAYSFGGGDALDSAYVSAGGTKPSAWVLVDARSLESLLGSGTLPVELPGNVEVFDGGQLYTFSAGSSRIAAARLPQLIDGVAYLGASDALRVREQIGEDVASALPKAAVGAETALSSNLRPAQLQEWLGSLGAPTRAEK